MKFILVYIAEAHAIDSAWPLLEEDHKEVIEEPITFEERLHLAGSCASGLDLGDMTTVVDGMDNAVNRLYDAHPDRLYLVGRDGHMSFCGGPGPAGFDLDALETAIKKELKKIAGDD